MKILIAGDWHSELHEEAVYNAFKMLGHEVLKFPWHGYFKSNDGLASLSGRLQNRFIIGSAVHRVNRDLVRMAVQFEPDMLFVYRGTHITIGTLKKIKLECPNITLVGYNNDDPFAKGHHYSLWRHFLKAVPAYDLMLAYRHHNLEDFLRIGAKRVKLLRSWYFPERNHPVVISDEEKVKYECDVVFVGHYEDDFRLLYLEELVKRGVKLRIFGPGYDWDPVLKKSPILRHLLPVHLVWNEEYNKALCGAKIALCFLSKLNRDTYTRRCFEIPATKTFMLSEYTDDLANLYKAGVDVDFFRSKDELIEKVKLYVGNDQLRKAVALNGYNRVIADGHNVNARMQLVLEWVASGKNREGKLRG